jgi:hypothetical protein
MLWITNAAVITKGYVSKEEAKHLLNSFLVNEKMKMDKPGLSRCLRQQRVRNHD